MIRFTPLLLLIVSCSTKNNQVEEKPIHEKSREVITTEFQSIIDSAKLKGSILIYDLQADQYFSNDFNWARKGNLPASTYKITNSIIALETGVVEDDSTLFKWDGQPRALKIWEQDLILKEAFHRSCVPCYQEVARKIGAKRMREHLDKFEYGNIKVDSTNIDLFWLEGESRITPFQQIDFLQRFFQSKLPISERTESIMKQMMVMKETDHLKLSGKTGWSIRNGNNNGWFVGYIETSDITYFFATNVEPKSNFDMDKFPAVRKEITFEAFEKLGLAFN